MNANELADLIGLCGDGGYNQDAATMLRQQQAEIETLKAGKIRAYDNGVEDGKKSNTNPAKTLTDEEIMNIFNSWTNRKQEHNLPAGNIDYFHQEMIEFARAILRKAQE